MAEDSEGKFEKLLDLGHTEAENHAKTQQELYEKYVNDRSTVSNQLSQFFKTNIFGFAWHYLKSRFGPRHAYQYYPTESDTGIYPLQSSISSRNSIEIALLSDWASDTQEADAVAHLVAKYAPDYTIHMGDVYFVGTPEEIHENFTAPHASWYYGKSGSLVLSGNHEMYSNGNAFFQKLLPAMYAQDGQVRKTQQAGFFCLENEHWRIIGIDTAYTSVGRPFLEILVKPDCHLRKEQIAWLRDTVKLGDPEDRRGLVFLSHHPYFSSFREEYPKPAQQIRALLGKANRPVVWLWGHDHRMVVYHPNEHRKGPLAYGRCIGHGGLPVEIKLPNDAVEQDKIQFYDRRVRKILKRRAVGFNGFAHVSIQGAKLIINYRDMTDTSIMEEEWVVNKTNSQLEWKINHVLPELTI